MSLKDHKFLDIARNIALENQEMKRKHGAVIVYKNKIISKGNNCNYGHLSCHAEQDAIRRSKQCVLWV